MKAFGHTKILLKQGDITAEHVDAIVNAANSSLLGGGGVDGAIHRVGGGAILQECKEIREREGPCRTGQAVMTCAGNLHARHVIHTVGPVWKGGGNGEADLLGQCYQNSLQLAVLAGDKTIAFPAISAGAYGFPIIEAAYIALDTVQRFVTTTTSIDEVRFILFSDANLKVYEEAIQKIEQR